MRHIKVRLATSTALATAVLAFYNLPVQAIPELGEEGQLISHRAMTRTFEPTDHNKGILDLTNETKTQQVPVPKLEIAPIPETQQVSVPQLEVAPIPETQQATVQLTDELPATVAKPAKVLLPLVEIIDGKTVPTAVTRKHFNNFKDMNDVAYNITKGYGTHTKLTIPVLERLKKEGWQWKVFSGLEGVHSEFTTSAGIVFFHREENLVIIPKTGTSSNPEGWGTNGKSNKVGLTVQDIQGNYLRDLFNEAKEKINDALDPKERATNPSAALSQEVLNIIDNKLGVGISFLDNAALHKTAAKLNHIAFTEKAMDQEALKRMALKLLSGNIAKSKLSEQYLNTIANELAKEAMIQRELVKKSEDKEYRKALKSLKAEINRLQSINPEPLKKNFIEKIGGFLKHEKKEAADRLTARAENDQSLAKALLAFGALKIQTQEGGLKANPDFARRLHNIFDVKMKVMETVARLEDQAKINNSDHIGQGEVHLGFLQKTLSTLDEIYGILKDFGLNNATQIIFTGHSMGGGLGEQAAALFTANFAPALLADENGKFDNKKSHNVGAYLFSKARGGDETFAKWVNKDVVGRNMLVRHNVLEDIVPLANGDNAFAAWLKASVPVLYGLMRDNVGYEDTGYLAAQSGHETWQLAKAIYAEEGFDVSKFDKLDAFIHFLASFKLGSDGVPTALAGESENLTFIYQPGKYVWNKIWNTYAVAYTGVKGVQLLLGNEGVMAEMKELFTKRYAHLHLGKDDGYSADGTYLGAHFDTRLIINPDQALARGDEHEQKRAEKKKSRNDY